ncbi:MAG: hypothetical protein HYR89_02685, partial [Actinobacteria bacterium]|nr:hypothetical protein [Actinomycetota bacterium]
DAQEPEPEQGSTKPQIDELFARLRAGREESVAHAQAVLGEGAAADTAIAEAPVTDESARDEEPAQGLEPLQDRESVKHLTSLGGREHVEDRRPIGESSEEPDAVGGLDEAVVSGSALPDIDDDRVFQERDRVVEPIEQQLIRSLKRVLMDEQNEMLDYLRRLSPAADTSDLLPDHEPQVQRYVAAVRPFLEEAATAGAARFGVEAMDHTAAEASVALARDLLEGLRDRLARHVGEAVTDQSDLATAISSVFREWKTTRIEPLGRHHVLTVYGRAAFEAAPEGLYRWAVDPEQECSPDCVDNELAGPVPKGERFPTGVRHPPAHGACRCIAIPLST